ncbi:hypothetical protein AAVH_29866 [Aphelenchoides avenae]|nr:hypothetical protein AAVH_29866 [Aphelenchus avenae]
MDFYLDLDEDVFEAPKPERVRYPGADRQTQRELAMERKRLEANRNFEEWWQLKPVRMPSEVLSTLAKVQIVQFIHDWDSLSPLRRSEKEFSYVASYHCRQEEKELMQYAKTDGHRLTFGKCTDDDATAMLHAIGHGPLEFRDEVPLGLIHRACKDYLCGADSIHTFRDIICNFSSSSVTDRDVLPTDVCSEIYATLFPCPRCSASGTVRQVFHHKGVNGRELRYELGFSCWDDTHVVRDRRTTLRALHDIRGESFAPIKSVLWQTKISASMSNCVVSRKPTSGLRTLVALFKVYARDVFAFLDRCDLDRSELVSLTWRQMLLKMRASLALRSLCVELVMALDGTWVVPIIYNPGVDERIVDRRQFKLPHRSPELDSQLVQGHLRNSFIASIVVTHEWGEDMPDTSNEAIKWAFEMLGGLDNCRIGELHFWRIHPGFDDASAVFNRAMTCNRPQKLNISFDSDEQFRQFITLEAFLLGGRLRGIEHAQFSMTASHGPVMPAWRLIIFLTPCVRKLAIHYEIYESADASGLRHVVDDIVEDFQSLEGMAATDTFDFYLSIYRRPVPLLRENHVSTRSNVHLTDASWCGIGDFACEEFRFLNKHCHKELIVYTSVTEYESVALCRLR